MEQYIPKSALVAELARQKAQWRICKSSEAKYRQEMLDDILSFINTLEVKEIGVDLGDPKGDKSAKYIIDTKTLEVKEVQEMPVSEDLEDIHKTKSDV